MTAGRGSFLRIGGVAAALLFGLPIPPLPAPTALPTPSLPLSLPTPSLPVNVGQPLPPVATPTGAAAPSPSTAAGRPLATGGLPAATAAPAEPDRGVPIPFTGIYVSSPLDIAIFGALATLPLLLGIWLLLFGRTLARARRLRDAQVRLMLAADLGLRPRDLESMSTSALFDLREKSAFDQLTGVLSRAAGISAAEREIARARRHKTPLAVAFIDIDGLQEANDSDGHSAGDAMLRDLTRALREGLHADDLVFRYGADEFVCVMPETTAPAARRVLGQVQDQAATAGIRFCAGVAELDRSDDVVSLFARADRDLYDFKAKRGEIVQLPTQRAIEA